MSAPALSSSARLSNVSDVFRSRAEVCAVEIVGALALAARRRSVDHALLWTGAALGVIGRKVPERWRGSACWSRLLLRPARRIRPLSACAGDGFATAARSTLTLPQHAGQSKRRHREEADQAVPVRCVFGRTIVTGAGGISRTAMRASPNPPGESRRVSTTESAAASRASCPCRESHVIGAR